MLTEYHAKYFAHELTRCCASDNVEKLVAVLSDTQAQVDLNPHQIEAAKAVEKQKDELLDTVEERLKQTLEEKELFTIKWRLV